MRFPTLRLYWRLLGFLRPHLGLLAASVVLMTGFAAFSGFTLAMIIPFTEIVLTGAGPETPAGSVQNLFSPGGQTPGGTDQRPIHPSVEAAGDPDHFPIPPSDEGARGPGQTLIPSADEGAGGPGQTLIPSAAEEADSARTVRAGPVAGDSLTPGAEPEHDDIADTFTDLRRIAEEKFYGLIKGKDRGETLRRFCVALVLIFLIKNLFWYGQSFLVVRVEQFVIRDIRNRVFGHYQTLSMDYFSQTNTGTLISRVTNDIELVKGAVANGVADLLRQSLLLLVYLVTVLLASWQLFLFAILILPPNLWVIDRIGQTLRRSSRISQVKMARLTAVLNETLGSMRIVKAFGLEPRRVDRFNRETQDYADTMVRMTRIGSLASPLTEILGVLAAAAILWFAGSQVAKDPSGAGRFMLFIVGMLSMMQPIKVLSQLNIRIQQGLAASKRIFEVLDTETTVRETPGALRAASFEREIRLDGVSFAYRPDTPVLQGIDMVLKRGEVVALVGPSGGGKSTLIDLIPRFHDPTAGRITLDGIDLKELRLEDLRRLIGLVTQETILFEGTVRDNIEMGRPGADDASIRAAAEAANAHQFIEQLPEGYDSWIGERGLLLSGGQRQRLAIARAILRNPDILIFDEATSALDTESESLVQAAIDNLLRQRTALVIAHRLSTVRHADRIVVLEQGRIVQQGAHGELMEQGGLYRRLYEMQFRDESFRAEGPHTAGGTESPGA